jgi:hypothetical protein
VQQQLFPKKNNQKIKFNKNLVKMQSQIESAVTNGSANGSKESSLRPVSPQESTKENGINGLSNGTNNSNGTNCNQNSTKNNEVLEENRSLSPSTVQSQQQTSKTLQQGQTQQSQESQQNQNGSPENNDTKDNLTKDDKHENNLNGKQENSSNLHHVNKSVVVNTFHPDPSKSAFMSPNNGGSPGNSIKLIMFENQKKKHLSYFAIGI